MSSSVNIKDIARICGVGVSTVSRAINDHPDVNPETKAMIRRVIEEQHYVPNNSARNLKRVESNSIALLVKGVSNSFFSEMITIMEREVKLRGYSLVLHRVESDEDEVEVALELVHERRLKGIIFLGGYFNQSSQRLKQLGVPFVLSTTGSVPEKFNRNTYSSVSIDDVDAARRMTEYLISLGHEKIAILGTSEEDVSIGHLRLQGYQKALQEAGLPVEKNLILPMQNGLPDFSVENGYAVMKEFLASGRRCSAVFAISDTMAIGAMRAIYDAGLSVPKDISVAGFDGIGMGRFTIPSLTTVRQPIEQMARTTTEILFEIIQGNAGHRHEIYPGELMIRESTK